MREALKFYRIGILTVMTVAMALTGCGRQDNTLELELAGTSESEELKSSAAWPAGSEEQTNSAGTDKSRAGKPEQYGVAGNPGVEGSVGGQGGTQQAASEREVCVYVCGAVQNPGLVTLPSGSRAGDAVDMAGGMTVEADDAYVNLAARVEDGEKIFIPTRDEVLVLEKAQEAQENGLVNINTADSGGLCTLPGIGESRAADIISYREKNGSFGSIEDIMKVPGIKESAFEKIRDRITVE